MEHCVRAVPAIIRVPLLVRCSNGVFSRPVALLWAARYDGPIVDPVFTSSPPRTIRRSYDEYGIGPD